MNETDLQVMSMILEKGYQGGMLVMAGYFLSQWREFKTAIQELNKTMAVMVERMSNQKERSDKQEARIDSIIDRLSKMQGD
jgi:hypothetical protein